MEMGDKLWAGYGLGSIVVVAGSNSCYWVVSEGVKGAMEEWERF